MIEITKKEINIVVGATCICAIEEISEGKIGRQNDPSLCDEWCCEEIKGIAWVVYTKRKINEFYNCYTSYCEYNNSSNADNCASMNESKENK